jgi:hypothetical protein
VDHDERQTFGQQRFLAGDPVFGAARDNCGLVSIFESGLFVDEQRVRHAQ